MQSAAPESSVAPLHIYGSDPVILKSGIEISIVEAETYSLGINAEGICFSREILEMPLPFIEPIRRILYFLHQCRIEPPAVSFGRHWAIDAIIERLPYLGIWMHGHYGVGIEYAVGAIYMTNIAWSSLHGYSLLR